jgi:hypothetical protein
LTVFTGIEKDAPPFAYHSLNLVRGARAQGMSTDFLTVLGARETPSDEDIVAWLFAIESGDAGLTEISAVTTAVKLLEMFVETYPDGSPAQARLRAPDTTGKLRAIQDLVIDDAPWLHERVHLDRVPMTHAKITLDTARGIGAGELSQCVDEVLQVEDAATKHPIEHDGQICRKLMLPHPRKKDEKTRATAFLLLQNRRGTFGGCCNVLPCRSKDEPRAKLLHTDQDQIREAGQSVEEISR